MTDDDLFQLAEVCDVSVFVNPTVKKACSTTFTTTSRNQNEIELVTDRLFINKALHEVCAPGLRDTLRLKLCQHVSVPAEVLLDVVLGVEAMLFVQPTLPLQITCQVIIVGEVEAFGQIARDLLDDFSYLLSIEVLLLRSCGLCFSLLLNRTTFLEEGNDGDTVQSVDGSHSSISCWLLVSWNIAHGLSLRCDHEMVEAVNREYTKEATDFIANNFRRLTHE